MNARIWMVCGAVLAALGVGLGAYHAHGLHAWLQQTGAEPEQVVRRLQNADVAVRYQMYQALGLLTAPVDGDGDGRPRFSGDPP